MCNILRYFALWFSEKPTHMASFGYVFPRRTVILVMAKATRHSFCSSCRRNDKPIGFSAESGKQCGTRHQSYQINITTLSCWWGTQFLETSCALYLFLKEYLFGISSVWISSASHLPFYGVTVRITGDGCSFYLKWKERIPFSGIYGILNKL